MQEEEFQVDAPDTTTPKKKSKKKGCIGCGCGCLTIILIILGLAYWLFQPAISFFLNFSDLGYTVQGDQAITVEESDTVEGDALYFGKIITIDGTVNGNVAVLCEQVIISGTINGDLDLYCDLVTVTETGVVTGDIRAAGVRLIVIDGEVEGAITGNYKQLIQPDTE